MTALNTVRIQSCLRLCCCSCGCANSKPTLLVLRGVYFYVQVGILLLLSRGILTKILRNLPTPFPLLSPTHQHTCTWIMNLTVHTFIVPHCIHFLISHIRFCHNYQEFEAGQFSSLLIKAQRKLFFLLSLLIPNKVGSTNGAHIIMYIHI